MEDLRYPIGKVSLAGEPGEEQRRELIDQIASTPANLRAAVAGLAAGQLDTPYREGGWTVRQVVHHLADSHVNSYVRFRLALTEDKPLIKAYQEKLWAELVDARSGPIDPSLAMLEGLHTRWVVLLRSLGPADWARVFQHPERGPMTLWQNLALYAWHGRHHVAQIQALCRRMGWS